KADRRGRPPSQEVRLESRIGQRSPDGVSAPSAVPVGVRRGPALTDDKNGDQVGKRRSTACCTPPRSCCTRGELVLHVVAAVCCSRVDLVGPGRLGAVTAP